MTPLKSSGRSLPLEHQLSRYVEDELQIKYEYKVCYMLRQTSDTGFWLS